MNPSGEIVVSGAREHNLKDLHLRLPRNSLIVITGLSGSGKSSLAFDTIYAEGQRRYVESLSAYARQFLGQMDKPDVDSIEGLSPAISIDQKTTSRNPRSTVGTVTEIYDYLRLLWARVGHPHCYNCGRPIAAQSAEQVIDQVMQLPEGTKFMVLAPVVRGRKGEYGKLFEELRADGFTRVKVDGELRRLEEDIVLDKKYKHDISVVIDRLVMRHDLRKRLADSIETAVARAEGIVDIEDVDSGELTTYSERFMCLHCGTSMPELEPRMFSFNSPHGACPRCTGLGSQMEIDPELIVPDPSLSLNDGAILPWSTSASNYYEQMTQAIADKWEVDMDRPWEDLAEDVRKCFLYGTNGDRIYISYRNRYGRRRSYTTTFEGIVPNLERRYRETDSDWSREKIEEYMTLRPCPECKGARLRPESLAVKTGGLGIHEFTRMSARRAIEWLEKLELSDTERQIARMILREIDERLRFLDNVGVGYLSLERAAATLSGGEAQRIRLATQIGSSLVGVLYILDEPSIGLHQRDNERLIATLQRLRDLGNTVIVVEHDEGTMRAADHVVDLGPGAGEHGGELVAEGTPEQVMSVKESATGQFLSGEREIPLPKKRRRPSGYIEIEGAAQHNLQNINVKVPLGVFCSVTGVSGSGKSTLVNEVLFKAVANRLHRAKQRPGTHKRISGLDQIDKIINIDQSPIGRTPRSNPATYIGLFDHIRELYSQDAGGACARVQAGSLLVQREGRPLRGLPRRRPDQDRNALPPGRVRALRAVSRQALQPRDARGPLQEQDDRRRARHDRRGGGGLLRAHPEDQAQAPGAARRGARLHPAGPARHHAVGRRGAAREAGERAVEGGHGPDPLHPRRAHHRTALRGRPAPARDAEPAGGPGQHGRRDRAQPRRDQDLRPPHRPRAGGRRGGRQARGAGNAGAGGRHRRLTHRQLPGRDSHARQAQEARYAGEGARRGLMLPLAYFS